MPVAVRPDVAARNLRRLLAQGVESETLDYKRVCDPSNKDELIEIVKDVAAMQIDGGYIVIGADDQGRPSGEVTEQHARLFDESRLRAMVLKHLNEPLELLTSAHEIDGNRYVLIYVGPSSEVFAVIARDGGLSKGGPPVFRKGDVFARHGTASERWNQRDIAKIRRRVVARERERWLREATEAITSTMTPPGSSAIAAAPVGTLNWQIDGETFKGSVLELINHNQLLPIRYLISNIRADVGAMLAAPEGAEPVEVVLDRLTCLAALLLQLDELELFPLTISGLVEIYRLPIDAQGSRRSNQSIPPASLWFAVIQRVAAIGGLAVRLQRWTAIRTLVLQRGKGPDFDDGNYSNWYRHGLIMASRDSLMRQAATARDDSILTFALRQVERLACLRPDMHLADQHEIINSLVQFDVLAGVVAIDETSTVDSRYFYPSFARYYTSIVSPVVELLIENSGIRNALLTRNDADLAAILNGVDIAAHREGFLGWGGFSSKIKEFIREHLPPSE